MRQAPTPISIEEARNIVKEHIKLNPTETVLVTEAVGRIVAHDLVSDIDVTPFDDSAMDGFAVITSDLAQASDNNPVTLTCVDHIGAGGVFEGTLQSGQTARIMTGALVPEGADAIVKIEDVAFTGEGSIGDAITFRAPTKLGHNIRKAGEEAKAGDVVVEAGELITAAGAGLLAACGNLYVDVYKRPMVGLISIGSELVEADEVPGRGMIRNSNVWAMQAYVAQAGGMAKVYPTVPDDVDAIKAVYLQAVSECDLVVSTGGACLGDFDLTPGILMELGTMHFERVSVKPGKSQPFGEINGTPVFVLSGNPAASSMGFELYVRLAMRAMQGYTQLDRPTVKARITCDIRKKDPRVFLERAVLSRASDGGFEVVTLKNQSSALFGALQRCNCFAVIPEGLDGVRAGDEVTCIVCAADESLPLGE